MKNYITFILLLVMSVDVNAQGQMKILFKDGTQRLLNVTNLDKITWTGDQEENTDVTFVDMGLSVEWATCNLGASNESDFGDYYAWGETATKTSYSSSPYFDSNDGGKTYIKYNNQGGKTILEPENDAAHVKLGGNWRIPTDQEWIELRTKCEWVWTHIGGINGTLITASNGNSIFLPAAGEFWKTTHLGKNLNGNYWSSSLYSEYDGSVYYVDFYQGYANIDLSNRIYGRSIRPVRSKVKNTMNIVFEDGHEEVFDISTIDSISWYENTDQ